MATANIHPDDNTANDWTVYPSGEPEAAIDEGTVLGGHTPNDADYIYSNTAGHDITLTWGDSPADTNLVTQIVLNVRAKIDDGNGTGRLQVKLFHSTSTQIGSTKYITGTNLGGYGTLGEYALTWSSLTLTKTQVDSLTVEIVLLAS